jgi:ribosomal protein S18 acetylase RimI-like enzyme
MSRPTSRDVGVDSPNRAPQSPDDVLLATLLLSSAGKHPLRLAAKSRWLKLITSSFIEDRSEYYWRHLRVARSSGEAVGVTLIITTEALGAARAYDFSRLLVLLPSQERGRLLAQLRASAGDLPAVPPGFLYLSRLCVHADHRGVGIGKRLMEDCLQLAAQQQRGLCLHVDEANTSAVRLYESLGLTVSATGMDVDELRHLLMTTT